MKKKDNKEKDKDKDKKSAVNPDEEKCEKSIDENKEEEQKEVEKTKEEILTEENAALNDRVLRLMAEFENYKKRTSKEKDEMFLYAKTVCVNDFLSVLDNLSRAMQTSTTDETFKKGIDMILTQFNETLKKLGVEEIEALNSTFDPNLHNAIKQVEDENFGENTVCEVFQKGYVMGEKVVRHAMVVVANP